MSMTREEASKILRDMLPGPIVPPVHPGSQKQEAIQVALTALRGPTREQVERMRGEWEWYDEEIGSPLEGTEREWGWRCSKCKVVLPDDFDDPDNPPAMRFCQWCGAPMTDEAVDMMLERWKEAVDNESPLL